MSDRSQTFASHARFVPPFHFVLSAMLLLNFVWTIRHIIKTPTAQHGVDLMLAVAFLLIFGYMRAFAVGNQDRIIRLEEALRMERLLPPDLKGRTGDLTIGQIVGLRFASDAELPALVKRALDEKLSRKAIKQAVKTWRPDNQRV